MSIRTYNKDHLKEHASITLAVPVEIAVPESGDPLVFWTQHEREPFEVNIHAFATGQEASWANRKFIPFTGRPGLIRQLTPALEEVLVYAAQATVRGYLNTIRDWWRVLDAVEAAAATAGQLMTRVEDVRLLTNIHVEFAHRRGMTRQAFGKFRALVDLTRIALGARQTYWESPENSDAQKHIPPQERKRPAMAY